VSFDLAAGAVLVLRGANGAGKTTLLRTLAGLQPPIAGEIIVEPDICAYASHADGVKATLTVTENLAFWADVHGCRVEKSVFSDFALDALSERMGGTLSAGQRRRLGLARLAVIGRPVLFLDEPTVSLDAASVARFSDWLRNRHLAAGGIAVVATHVDLGFEAPVLDLDTCRAGPLARGGADEAFL
jgi:heme exporter protein A